MIAPNDSTTLATALRYLALGWAVLPVWSVEGGRCDCGRDACDKPGKHPIGRLVPHGVNDASKDPAEVRGWDAQMRRWNIGLATGAPSGFDVLDVDGEAGRASLARLEQDVGTLPETVEAITGGGGRHLLFVHAEGLKNAVGLPGYEGLDVRTTGGFIVAPPSDHASGRTYQWDAEHEPGEHVIAYWPIPVASLVRKVAPERVRPTAAATPSGGFTRYGQKAADAEIATLRATKEGGRNAALNLAAYNLGQLHAGGEIPDLRDTLESIGVDLGLEQAEARKTAASGWGAGLATPRKAPPRAPRTAQAAPASGAPEARLRALPPEEGPPSDASPPPRDDQEAGQPDEPDRPVVRVGPDLMRMNNQAEAALLVVPSVRLYQNAQRLVEVRRDDGLEVEWLARPPGAPSIVAMRPARLCELLSDAARFEKWNERKKGYVHCEPKPATANALLDRGGHGFPLLEGITESPFLRPDGSACTTPGYDPSTAVIFDPGSAEFQPPPENPTRSDAEAAFEELVEPYCDFSWVSSADLAAAVAAILSVVGRPAIRGPVPLFASRAHTAGSGKTLFVDTVSIIATGRDAPAFAPVDDDDEWRKRIMAIALDGASLVNIDNVDGALGSAPLASALTASVVSDRLLGASQRVSAPMRAVWFATGNNLSVRGDLGRRVIPVDQDPKAERPAERDGPEPGKKWRYPQLRAWVKRERARLVRAALTVLMAFCRAGRPTTGKPPMGSYEAWDDLVRAAVLWVSHIDPCDTRLRLQDVGDADDEPIRAVLGSIAAATTPGERLTVPVLIERAMRDGNEALKAALGAFCRDPNKLDARAIGNAIARRVVGRTLGGARIENVGRSHGGFTTYVLHQTAQQALALGD